VQASYGLAPIGWVRSAIWEICTPGGRVDSITKPACQRSDHAQRLRLDAATARDPIGRVGRSLATALCRAVLRIADCAYACTQAANARQRHGVARTQSPLRTPVSVRKATDRERSAGHPSVSGVEQLPVPFGDDLNGAVDHFDGRLIVYSVRRHR